MTSFDFYESSQEDASRIELYSLAIGNDVYRMHDQVTYQIDYDTNPYYKTSISRGHIATGQEHLTINLPGDHGFSQKFTTIAPGQLGTLTIYAYHRGFSSDVKVIYKGVVRSVAFTSDMTKSLLSVVPVSDAFDKEIPQRTFQASCNNVLFDADCKLAAASYKYTNDVSLVSSNNITVIGLSASKGSGWSTGGYVAYSVLDYRLILAQTGDVCELALPFYADVTGEEVDVYAGCDRTIATCNSKFGNKDNFGGCPYVPTKEIFKTGI